jgi:phage shock protein PspC (stress-responsive transcriptional regulator)
MARKEPRRHLVRGVLGGLLFGLGLALLLVLFRVTVVGSDIVIGICLLIGIVLGSLRLPRGASATGPAPPG